MLALRRLGATIICGVMVSGAAFVGGAAALPPDDQFTATRTRPAPRAMWLWSESANPSTVVTWATYQGVDEIFAYVPVGPLPATTVHRLTSLRNRTAAAGIRLTALGGEPGWTPETALLWRAGVVGTGLFDGLHLDVEPYLDPSWETDRIGAISTYLDLLDRVGAAGPETVEADVPFWYAEIDAYGTTLADAVLDRVDAVTVMSYRDTSTGANSILGVGADILTRGEAAGKPVRLAAETRPVDGCAYCSFASEGRLVMQRRLAEVDGQAWLFDSYNGIAVHDYDGWSRMRL